jgi:Tol biopolymer transport system component
MLPELKRLFSELRRRKVLGVAAAYGVAAWGVLQVSGTVLQMAGAPVWIARVVLVVVAAGFPLALVLAWIFDLSRSGLVRTAPSEWASADQPNAGIPGRHILGAALLVVALTVVTVSAVWLRPSTRSAAEFMQLTSFSDAATAPALSPDGRLVAFLKGGGDFANSATVAQLYIKQLPNGEAIQLTNTLAGKATPAFTPDGTRVTFTVTESNFRWATYVVSTNGGPVTQLLPNASGLTWIDGTHVLYSEIRKGAHMGLRKSAITREDVQDVYWPQTEQSMAHRSAVSPDRRWILIVEMENGVWQPCRLIPFDDATPGRNVGPPGSQCTYAAWSPDGRWMYTSSNAGGAFHIWRQRFPNGEPEQLTDGPTEEEGIAVAPDGRSLITSAGVRHHSIWLLDARGERQLSVEEFAFAAVASTDGARLYFLSRAGNARRASNVGNLIVTSLESGAREQLLPGHSMAHFDLSADDSLIVFASGSDDAARRGIWLAPLDRSAAPRRVFDGATERAFFDPARNIYFLATDGPRRYLQRSLAPDYTVSERIHPDPVHVIFSISPDGDWIIVAGPRESGEGGQEVAISTRGLPRRMICSFCGASTVPARILPPPISWTRDGRTMLASAQYVGQEFLMGPSFTVAIPVRPGALLPDLPIGGIESVQDYTSLPDARTIAQKNVVPGATADQLFLYKPTTLRNLYRLQLPR